MSVLRRSKRRSSSTESFDATHMGFWSGQRLLSEGAKNQIVAPFDPEKIDCSAYTLTLGAEVYITPGHGDDLRQNLKKRLAAPTVETVAGKQKIKAGGDVKIPSGQFAFLLTEEVVSIPPDSMGFISLKSHTKFRGLINVSGFHVDPGFSGRLIFSVFNAGPSAIQLARGDSLFLLWIADLSGDTSDERFRKTKPGYIDIPSSLIGEVSRENHSLQALSEQINSIAEQFRIIKGVAVGVATVIALVVAVVALQPIFSDESELGGTSAELHAAETPVQTKSIERPNQPAEVTNPSAPQPS